MSNGTPTPPPGSSPPPGSPGSPGRLRRKPLVAAALVPLCLAGVLAWLATGGPGSGGGDEQASASQAPDRARDGDAQQDTARRGRPLAGKRIVIDPGHNPHNRDHLEEINRTVEVGTEDKACDNTGTATADGYAEAAFTLALARQVREDLEERGATVIFTHDGDTPYGPCVDERAKAGNRAKADASVSLHADGAPAGARGFHVILPAPVHEKGLDNRAIAGPSKRLGVELRDAFREATGARPADYVNDGTGLDTRDDLVGLNLSAVPKVFLECGNMRDPQDARTLRDPGWRARAAEGISKGIAAYLSGTP